MNQGALGSLGGFGCVMAPSGGTSQALLLRLAPPAGRRCGLWSLAEGQWRWGYQRELSSPERWLSARHSSGCFCALPHFILTLPYCDLHLTDEEVVNQGFQLRQSESSFHHHSWNSASKWPVADVYHSTINDDSFFGASYLSNKFLFTLTVGSDLQETAEPEESTGST